LSRFSGEPIIDHEIAARDANVRLWWRRALILAAVVALGSPLTAIAIWCVRHRDSLAIDYTPPGEFGSQMRNAYVAYIRNEDPAHRGWHFSTLAGSLHSYVNRMSEQEALYYLGPADETIQTTGGTAYVYRFRPNAAVDMQLIVSTKPIGGVRTLSGVTIGPRLPTTAPTTMRAGAQRDK
jgi:hypothetical protein